MHAMCMQCSLLDMEHERSTRIRFLPSKQKRAELAHRTHSGLQERQRVLVPLDGLETIPGAILAPYGASFAPLCEALIRTLCGF